MKFATYYDKNSWHVDNGTTNTMESLTDQSFRNNADINSLILQLGGVPRTPVRMAYRGTTEAVYNMDNYETDDWTFEDWQNQKAFLERKFLHLTPEAKKFFGSPQEFLKYCANPNNYTLENGFMEEVLREPEPTIQPPTQVGGNQSAAAANTSPQQP